ncbi:hypothetical protein SAMN05421812_10165 [Asanoa hainanensis]|uniref:Sulfatase-modifying factor enzyme 1 n=1 Tax=Asanoa hainanensis TaxID=560556 RepID=A0A239FT29_9ACTN|nr:hypothetical protein [Asanoa hainanensis]SNS60009.1 hypothetical protein SAMN05421812_10165 [Asanoa hainanensis]
MKLTRRTVIFAIGGVAAGGLAVAAAAFGAQSVEFASWLAGIGSLAATVATLTSTRGGPPAAQPGDTTSSTDASSPAAIPTQAPAPEAAPPEIISSPSSPAAPPQAAADAHLVVSASAWTAQLERPGVSEGLLRGAAMREISADLAPLDDLLAHSLPHLRVEIRTAYRPRTVQVGSVDQFWTVMLVDSILHDGSIGLQRWLLRATDLILSAERHHVPRLTEFWEWFFVTHLAATADEPADGLMATFVTEAIRQSGDDHKRLYPIIDLFIRIARDDPATLRLIRDALTRHDEVLRERGSSPALLKRVQVLLGRLGAAVGPTPFRPVLVDFAPDAICPYPFRAMEVPLTVGDVDAILRRASGADAAMPHVLSQGSTDGTAFGGLCRELTDILGSLLRTSASASAGANGSDEWRWDIPTVAEWVRLAGCVDQPYPWGHDLPTPLHANLKFDRGSRLSPVRTYMAGRTAAGVYDCCGGVHEIVREQKHDTFDTDRRFEGAFRLAGGSYLSPPHGVTGQRFRHLSARDRGGRPSCVGVRLIAYREVDEARRWESLKAFRLGRQRPPLARTTPTQRRATAGHRTRGTVG